MLELKTQSIDKRLTLTMLLGAFLLVVCVSVITFGFALNKQWDWEEGMAERSRDFMHSLVRARYRDLHAIALDKAVWDETYHFIENANPEYVITNMKDEQIRNARLTGIMLQDLDGGYIIGESLLSESLEAKVWDYFWSDNAPASNRSDSGVIVAENKIMMYVSHLVTDNRSKEAANGRLTVIREFDSEMKREYAELMGGLFEVILLNSTDTSVGFSFEPGYQLRIADLNRRNDALELLLELDFNNGVTLPLQFYTQLPRDTSGLLSPLLWLLPQLVVILGAACMILLLIRRSITRPLVGMSQDLTSAESGRFSFRNMPLDRDDELGLLANRINNLFSRIYQQHHFSQLLLNSIGELIITVNRQGQITFANPPALTWLGIEAEELYKLHLDYVLMNVDPTGPSVPVILHQLLQQHMPVEQVCTFRRLSDADKNTQVHLAGHLLMDGEEFAGDAVIILRLLKENQNVVLERQIASPHHHDAA